MAKLTRDVAGGGDLGNRRFQRYCAAFDWVVDCIDKGYYLEAIAILDSLLWDRLSSRLGHLTSKPVELPLNFANVFKKLVGDNPNDPGLEKDAAFREAVRAIQRWMKRRNEAMHATAKILSRDSSQEDFKSILYSHRQDAADGIKCLQDFDTLDTASRKIKGKSPASFPKAFFPERRGRKSCVIPQVER